MIRSPDDPDRQPRPEGGQEDKTPHHTIKGMELREIASAVMGLLRGKQALTLNAIGVLLWDKTADITSGTNLEEALWQLVEAKRLEFTMDAPVLFRRKRRRYRKEER